MNPPRDLCNRVLGPDNVFKYFEFMKLFNIQNAQSSNSMLQTEHEQSKSLDYLAWLHDTKKATAAGLVKVNLAVGGKPAALPRLGLKQQ